MMKIRAEFQDDGNNSGSGVNSMEQKMHVGLRTQPGVLMNGTKQFSFADVAASLLPEREYILGPIMPGKVVALAGADGGGKTWLMLAAGCWLLARP
ncbi:hypothetical protein THIX_60974 [Thiomonas sp. X19]|uniref:hypothetical protein n=1 Tax=Thiomonas sp. X19 TaxID=1050370 RepID=UPI000B6E8B6C|nr:hypothetical protein [Thiomonas sp. X19]SCC94916.1 hypothetical protein THIX_60974 [Thiomonas sp. X19]